MFAGLYSSTSGMLAQMKNMDTISNNLANVNTSGFKKNISVFRSFYDSSINATAGELTSMGTTLQNRDTNSMAIVETSVVDYSAGAVKETGNPLDIAFIGDGFFELQGADGETFYSRAGRFELNQDGEIVNPAGYKLMGEIGPMIIGDGSGAIGGKGINIDETGLVTVGDEEVDRVSVIRFVDNNRLQKIGGNLLTNADDANISSEPFEGRLYAGHIEVSNVNPVLEMTEMITTTRAFEAYQKVIRAIMDDTTEKSINMIGRVR